MRIVPSVVVALVLGSCSSPAPAPRGVGLVEPLEDAVVAAGPLTVQAQVQGAATLRLTLDGAEVAQLEVPECPGTALVSLAVPDVAPGAHRLVLTGASYTVHRRFLAAGRRGAPNAVERASAPAQFSCLGVASGTAGNTLVLDVVPAAVPGRTFPDGARPLVALDGALARLPPLACSGAEGARTCVAEDASLAPVTRFELTERRADLWTVRLSGDGVGASPAALYLRVGEHGGGLAPGDGRRLVSPAPSLDAAHRVEQEVGPAGGVLQAQTASGALVTLRIREGALDAPTRVAMTPLLATPFAGPASGVLAAVQLEPDGLGLAEPAELTVEAPLVDGAAAQAGLVVSGLAAVPVPRSGSGNQVTARLYHFSTYALGGLGAYVSWANSALLAEGEPSLASIESLLATYAEQLRLGCTESCVAYSTVESVVRSASNTLQRAACAESTTQKTEAEMRKLRTLVAFALANDLPVNPARDCLHDVVARVLSDQAVTARDTDPTPPRTDRDDPALLALVEDPNRPECDRAVDIARCFGFADLEAQARRDLEAALVARARRIGFPATEDLDDPSLKRAAALATLASALALDNARHEALKALDLGLRFWLGTGRTYCRAGNAQGKVLLGRAKAWVTSIAPEVVLVDYALASDIDSALSGCNVCAVLLQVPTGGTAVGKNRQVQITPTVTCGADQRVTWSVNPSTNATVSGGVFVGRAAGQYTVTARSVANSTVFGSIDLYVTCDALDFVGVWNARQTYFDSQNATACKAYYSSATLTMELVDAGVTDQMVATYQYAPTGCWTRANVLIQGYCSYSGWVGPDYCHFVEMSGSLNSGKLTGSVYLSSGPIPCTLTHQMSFQSP